MKKICESFKELGNFFIYSFTRLVPNFHKNQWEYTILQK